MFRKTMRIALAAIIPAMCLAIVQAKDFTVKSPEGKVTLNVSAGDKLTWQGWRNHKNEIFTKSGDFRKKYLIGLNDIKKIITI